MEKITIPDYGVVTPEWLSKTLNRLSNLQSIYSDIHSRYVNISSSFVDPGLFVEADSIYHKIFADSVRAEFKKVKDLIFGEIYAELASITNGKGGESISSETHPYSMDYLQQETKRFNNLEENYIAAQKALCNQEKELPYPQADWLQDSFEKDFEREKLIFTDRILTLSPYSK